MEYNIKPHMTDSHFHTMEMIRKGMDVESVFSRLKASQTGILLDAGVILQDFEERLSWQSSYPELYYSAGIHPNISREEWPKNFETILSSQVQHPRVLAIGETGLDFYREYSSAEDQYSLLDLHYDLSRDSKKPLIFHIRDAEEAMCSWLKKKQFGRDNTAVLHCFQGNEDLAQIALEKGFYFSYAGNVTFKNAHVIRESLDLVPPDRILIETDAPYLAPHPMRGRDNHPGLIGHIYDFVAERKGIPLEDFILQVEKNLKTFLKLS